MLIRYLTKDNSEVYHIAIPWIGGSAFFRRFYPKLEEKRRLVWRKQSNKPSKIKMNFNNSMFKIFQNQKPKKVWKIAF